MDPSQGPIVAAFFPSGGTFTSAMRLASSTAVAWDGVADPLEPGPLLRLRSSLRPGDDGINSPGFCRGLLRTGVDWFAEARALVIQALQPAGSWGFSAPAPRWKGSLSSPSGFRTL